MPIPKPPKPQPSAPPRSNQKNPLRPSARLRAPAQRFSVFALESPAPLRHCAFALILTILLAIPPTAALAQSPQDPADAFQPLFTRTVEPFEVAMGWTPAAPQVGFVNVGVAPAALGGEPVTDARVTVVAAPQNDVSEAFEVVAVNTPVDPTVYRANMKFEHADNWTLSVHIASPTVGEASFQTPIVVLPPPIESESSGGWVFLGVFAALAAGAAYLVWSARRAQRARQRAAGA